MNAPGPRQTVGGSAELTLSRGWFRFALAAAGVSLLIGGIPEVASGNGPFAARIAVGHVSVSCSSVGPSAARVRLSAQVGYSDVARGREARLRGRRHRGSVVLQVRTPAGRRLARARDTEALELGLDRDRIYHTHTAMLGKRAGRRLLRYAHGTRRCRAKPSRNSRLEVVVRARQRLSRSSRSSSASRTQAARLRARTSVVSDPPAQGSTCPPYPCLGTAADLLAWDPSSARPFDVASVALAGRVDLPTPRMLVGFDNGPWSYWPDFDLGAQGSASTGNVYNFSHWQYLDSFYYYFHQLVSVPPTVWVNAAHRNGVTALGTVTADCNGCADEMNELFEQHGEAAVDQLQSLAATYGFDGWIIDVENGATLSDQLIAAMRELASRTLPNGRRVQVVYYQAGVYQLDEKVYRALQAAGSWQSDYEYRGASSSPRGTYGFLAQHGSAERRYDAHWATNVYGKANNGHPWNQPGDACGSKTSAKWLFNGRKCLHITRLFANQGSARAPTDPPAFFQSLALYAPDWTMYAGLNENTDPRSPRDVFQTVDALLWAGAGAYSRSGADCKLAQPGQNSVSALVEPRSTLTQVPFFTRFNTGEGSEFIVEGRATGTGSWNLLGAQDPLPMEVCGDGGTLGTNIDYDDAYDGGSSLRVSGTATADALRLYLYEADAALPQRPAFTLRYQLPGGAAGGPAPHVVVWIEGQGPIDLDPGSTTSEGGWTYTRAQLPASVVPGKLTRIGVGFDVTGDQQVDALIGELGVVDLASYERPAQIIPTPPPASTLRWSDPSASTTQYYNVWSVVPDESCVELAGRSTLPIYDLGHPLFALPDGARQFVVQPVSTSGLASQLSPPAC
jgi:hypothetical protein